MNRARPVTHRGFQEDAIQDRLERVTTIPIRLTRTQWQTVWFYCRKTATLAELEGNPANAKVLRQVWAELTRQLGND